VFSSCVVNGGAPARQNARTTGNSLANARGHCPLEQVDVLPDHTHGTVCAAVFADAVNAFRSDLPVLVLSHNDADGLSAAAILVRAFRAADRLARARILGRGETPWSEEIRSELRPPR
jgi:single-stranded DNA-specific DHH superfamily exonuclease